jgi:predicted porin
MRKTLFLVPLLLVSGAAMAADGHAFVRGEFGRSHETVSVSGLGEQGSDNDNAYSIRGGYFFGPHLGVEAFYSNLYDKTEDGVSLKGTSYGAGIVGKKNFGANDTGFFVDTRVGLARGKVEAEVAGLGSDSIHSVKPYFGLGAGYDFNANMGLSLNWDWQKTSDEGISVSAKTLTVGFEYRF